MLHMPKLKKIENKHQITKVITNDVNLFKCKPDKNWRIRFEVFWLKFINIHVLFM